MTTRLFGYFSAMKPEGENAASVGIVFSMFFVGVVMIKYSEGWKSVKREIFNFDRSKTNIRSF